MEMMVGMAGLRPADLDHPAPDRLGGGQLIVQAARLSGGVRKIIKISEIVGMEEDVVSMQDIFVFKQTGVDEERVRPGVSSTAPGIRPKCLEAARIGGRDAAAVDLFERRMLPQRAARRRGGGRPMNSAVDRPDWLAFVTVDRPGILAVAQVLSDVLLRDQDEDQ